MSSLDPARIPQLAALLQRRNAVDAEIAAIIGRPALAGHLGEWIAAAVFDIQLEHSAVSKGIDGRFRSGPLAGKTVDVKTYAKAEGLLDLPTHELFADYYLVLTGPKRPLASSRGGVRPFVISSVFVFAAHSLLAALRARGVKIGVATSVLSALWQASEVFPEPRNPALRLTEEQKRLLELFSP